MQWAIIVGHSMTGMLIGAYAPDAFSVELASTAEIIYFGSITAGFVVGTLLAVRCSAKKILRWIAMAQLFIATVIGVIIYLGSLGEDPYEIYAYVFRHYVYTSLVIVFAALFVVGSHMCWTRRVRRQLKDPAT
ncbi:hypothetical protein [Bythopirellula polymerisocia]|uniref:Uncharacterized protein n=1 Tax=Bythopirellula polymerisocia TaxID=2528003 RepID=A0A5C6C9W0_9BACT|nr:hypothetical protein [Bythopirellula polymerisocia]TWU20717.1 hypothetical protein Pla144_48840 [Bythopirellula polymerisocia]